MNGKVNLINQFHRIPQFHSVANLTINNGKRLNFIQSLALFINLYLRIPSIYNQYKLRNFNGF